MPKESNMRLPKFLLIISFITLISLLYVWQQTEIFRLAYAGRKNLIVFQDSLDKNALLRYNIERNASLIHIGAKIYASGDFQMPETYRLVRVSGNKILLASEKAQKQESLISRLFGIKRQAEAKTINTERSRTINR